MSTATVSERRKYFSTLSSTLNSSSDGSESSSSQDPTPTISAHVEEGEEGETCLICAESIRIASLSPCNHTVCHVCSFRNVALYRKSQCLVCRSEIHNFIFTADLKTEKFEQVKSSQLIPRFKNDHGIRYTSEFAKNETLKLLDFSCPIKSCSLHGKRMSNFKELNNHVKDVHNRQYCELCAKFKKAFISELKLYNKKQLHQHQSKGDSIGFKGHPECKFCSNKRFYSEDELYVHMRDHHERCHICQQIDPNNPQYFRNYEHLAQHFKNAHFTCNVQSCLDSKFVVFRDEFELQTHLAKEHSSLYGNNILFSGSFNSQLFSVPNEKKKITKKENNADSSNDYELKKKRLEERARHYLNYNEEKFQEFLNVNIDYSKEKISAQNVINAYKEIFNDSKDVDYDLLIYELSGLYPNKSKLRRDLEIINKPQLENRELEEKFPSLPGSSSVMDRGIWGSEQPKSKSKLKAAPSISSKQLFPSLPGVNHGNIVSSTKKAPKTRGIPVTPPVNGFGVPGYNPIQTGKKNKSVWNAPPLPPVASTFTSSSKSAPVHRSKLIDEQLFPSLPSPPKKKVIPRVNPVTNNGSNIWGSSSPIDNGGNVGSSFNMNELSGSLKAVKKGKKGKVVYKLDL